MTNLIIIEGNLYEVLQQLRAEALKNQNPRTYASLIERKITCQYILRRKDGILHYYAEKYDDAPIKIICTTLQPLYFED